MICQLCEKYVSNLNRHYNVIHKKEHITEAIKQLQRERERLFSKQKELMQILQELEQTQYVPNNLYSVGVEEIPQPSGSPQQYFYEFSPRNSLDNSPRNSFDNSPRNSLDNSPRNSLSKYELNEEQLRRLWELQ
jgi:hypothetical protein